MFRLIPRSVSTRIQKPRCTGLALYRLVFPNRVHRNSEGGSSGRGCFEVYKSPGGMEPSVRGQQILSGVIEL